MFGLGTMELIVIGVIVFLIFGAKRIPEIGKGLGGAIREFKSVKKEIAGEGEEKTAGEEKEADQKNPPALEDKVKEKVMEQIPGVREVMSAKKKIQKVKDFMK
ncbi:MAG: twin-arginine translocase TatA/TatE family subunit, partial [Pseudomonadota bacterium]